MCAHRARLAARVPLVLALQGSALLGCNEKSPATARLIDAAPDAADPDGPTPGCSPEGTLPLVTADLWAPVAGDRDPFSDWAEGEIECNPLVGFFPELGALEIDTGQCNFVTVEQPLPLALAARSELEVELVHFDLVAAAPATARAAVAFVGANHVTGTEPRSSWEKPVPIPAPANRIVERFSNDEELSVGDRILFHLQNHGQNTWMLVRIDWLACP
jgi:hypothetical protein